MSSATVLALMTGSSASLIAVEDVSQSPDLVLDGSRCKNGHRGHVRVPFVDPWYRAEGELLSFVQILADISETARVRDCWKFCVSERH